jgi:hypothetical protein
MSFIIHDPWITQVSPVPSLLDGRAGPQAEALFPLAAIAASLSRSGSVSLTASAGGSVSLSAAAGSGSGAGVGLGPLPGVSVDQGPGGSSRSPTLAGSRHTTPSGSRRTSLLDGIPVPRATHSSDGSIASLSSLKAVASALPLVSSAAALMLNRQHIADQLLVSVYVYIYIYIYIHMFIYS